METIIKKAQDYIYNNAKELGGDASWWGDRRKYEVQKVVVLDRVFWIALGKACGWAKDFVEMKISWGGFVSSDNHIDRWTYNALRFHEINLTEGWSKAVEYLTKITNGN